MARRLFWLSSQYVSHQNVCGEGLLLRDFYLRECEDAVEQVTREQALAGDCCLCTARDEFQVPKCLSWPARAIRVYLLSLLLYSNG